MRDHTPVSIADRLPGEGSRAAMGAFAVPQPGARPGRSGSSACTCPSTPVARYNRELRDIIVKGRAKPSFLVSHELPLDAAPDAYQHFDAREDGWTKVVLRPAA